MGHGEDILDTWRRCWATLTPTERAAYASQFPEPIPWQGFYVSNIIPQTQAA